MSFVTETPAKGNGAWALKGAVIDVHDRQLGKIHEYRCLIPWSGSMTLKLAGKFSSKKAVNAFVADTTAEGFINVYSAYEYRKLEKAPKYAWIKHHPRPHVDAAPSDLPCGNPFNYKGEES